ncbi:MAG: pirin family protein [Alphaproteobacteria bacterium]|nr:pirin family protein [Alphaproteobacteria bacterium]
MSILQNDPIETIIIPRSGDIGGFEVHRALPSKERQMVGPFIFWDQMGPGEFLTDHGVDVRPHPHIGLSTVTYLFKGSLDHKDSLGYDERILPGDVNVMTAGSGIVHSERTGMDIRQQPSNLFGIQSWLALPKAHEEDSPTFAHTDKGALPEMEYDGMRARVIMGNLWGKSAPVPIMSDTLYVDVELEAGGVFELPVETEERGVYVLNGEVEIAGIRHAPNQLLVFRPGDQVVVKATELNQSPVRMMVMGGEAMDGPRHIFWNFVSSDRERINQAKRDWKDGKFDRVDGDDEFIPLP